MRSLESFLSPFAFRHVLHDDIDSEHRSLTADERVIVGKPIADVPRI